MEIELPKGIGLSSCSEDWDIGNPNLFQLEHCRIVTLMGIQEQAELKVSIFHDKRALIIGGSGGIGRWLSLILADRGAQVFIHGAHEYKVRALVQEIKKAGGRAEGFAYPIDSVSEFCSFLHSLGDFDCVISAYGPFVQQSLSECSSHDWEHLVSHNLALPGALTSLYLSGMLQRNFGRFLYFGGTRTDALLTYKTNAAYAAAKSGLNVLVKSLAAEGRNHNVAGLLVCPGFVDTEYLDDAVREISRLKAPGGKLIPARVIAETALNLLDAEPCTASGAIVSLDSGFSAF